jgi:hypothetical protein
MTVELEKLAERFNNAGYSDIAMGISAWARVAKSRGLETFSTPELPEGAIRLPDLTIGGQSAQKLERALVSGGFKVSDRAKSILRNLNFTTLPKQQKLGLVRIRVGDLGLTGNPTTTQIYTKAEELGLGVCPPEVGPHLRLVYNQPLNEWLYIGMKQITDSYGSPSVFMLGRDVDGQWLLSAWANPGLRWYPKHEFVFSLRK